LLAAVAKLRERGVEALAELITKEMGKVISEARREVEGAVNKDDVLKLMRAANEVICMYLSLSRSNTCVCVLCMCTYMHTHSHTYTHTHTHTCKYIYACVHTHTFIFIG
jgi:hypothetical protein